MSTYLNDMPGTPVTEAAAPKWDSLQEQVRFLLAEGYPWGEDLRRRAQRRYPYPQLIFVTPVDEDGRSAEETFVCCCKDLSARGVGLFHPQPLESRRVILTFSRMAEQNVSLLAVLDWCRFTRHGWYESGGRLLRAVASPARLSEVDSSHALESGPLRADR